MMIMMMVIIMMMMMIIMVVGNGGNNDNDGDNLQEKSKTSDVWNFVDKITRKCPNCAKIFGIRTGTSSIRTHLKSHGLLLEKEKQTTLDSFIKRHSREVQIKKTQAVIEWIVLDIQSFKVVESTAFNNMISVLDPHYQIPGRGTVKNIIMKEFEKRRELIKNVIKNILGKVFLITDIWSFFKKDF